MNYKEFLRSWNPWHLRKRVAEQDAAFSRLYNENQVLQFQHSCHLGDIEHLKQQRDSNYTGLMTECEKLKEEVERLKEERRWFIYVFELYKFIEQDEMKGDTHEQK